MWRTSAITAIIMRCANENVLNIDFVIIVREFCANLLRAAAWCDESLKISIRRVL